MGPRPIVLCGPSGAGKSTLLKRLMDEFGNTFGFSVSHTTRRPRPGEQDGVDYYFVTKEEMTEAIEQGKFLEHAQYSGNLYGTSRKAVEDVVDSNRICVLDIEMEGVKQVKRTNLNPHYIFVRPPCIQSLEERLRGRGTETEDTLGRRLSVARHEIEYGEADGNFDLIVINEDLDTAYEKLKEFLAKDIQDLKSQS